MATKSAGSRRVSICTRHFFVSFSTLLGRCAALGLPSFFSPLDLDPVETAFAFDVLQPLEQPRHRRAVAGLGQQQELVAHLGAVERLLRRALEAFDMAGQRPAVLER